MTPADRALEVDRKWFMRHRRRTMYIRFMIDGEFDAPLEGAVSSPTDDYVTKLGVQAHATATVASVKQYTAAHGGRVGTLVVQVAPGFRTRQPVALPANMGRDTLRRLREEEIASIISR